MNLANNKKNIVILGGGFGGVAFAVNLKKMIKKTTNNQEINNKNY